MTAGPIQQLFAQALSKDTGLSFTAALAWAAAEVGSLNNLGIMSGGKPVAYPTPAAGAAAAAQLINSSSLYAGIRASVGKSLQAQLDAIARSPWHLGPSGLAAAGGVDPYYARMFAQYGYVPGAGGSAGTTPAPTSTPPPAAGGSSGGGTWTMPFINIPEGKILTGADVVYIQNQFSASGLFASPEGLISNFKLAGILNGYIGQPWNAATRGAIQQQLSASGAAAGSLGTDIAGAAGAAAGAAVGAAMSGVAAAITAAWGDIPGLAIGAGILVVVLVLGYSGLEELMG